MKYEKVTVSQVAYGWNRKRCMPKEKSFLAPKSNSTTEVFATSAETNSPLFSAVNRERTCLQTLYLSYF